MLNVVWRRYLFADACGTCNFMNSVIADLSGYGWNLSISHL